MPKSNQFLSKIRVNTWGTKDKNSSGMGAFVEQKLFGGGFGHTSMEMFLPIDDVTKEWISKYCYAKTFEEYSNECPVNQKPSFEQYMANAPCIIPVRLVTHTTKTARYNAEGTMETTSDKAAEVQYFKIDWSFGPGKNEQKEPFYLFNLEKDRIGEREGHQFEYSDKWKEYLEPEQRIHRGKLGHKVMTYAPRSIFHERDMDESAVEKMKLQLKAEKLDDLQRLEFLFLEKIVFLKKPKITGTLALIIKNIGLNCDQIKEDYIRGLPESANPKKIDMHAFRAFIVKKVQEHIVTIRSQLGQIRKEISPEQDQDNNLEQVPNEIKQEVVPEEEYHYYDFGGLDNMTFELPVEDPVPEDDYVSKGDNVYVSKGIPPDHSVELPLVAQGKGFSPENMLKKMRELSSPGKEAQFNLNSKNCSKTVIEILTAGAEHDPLLKHAVSEEAIGHFGTPQQVLGNVSRASHIIATNQQDTFLTRIGTIHINFLDQSMGKLLFVIMNNQSSTILKVLALVGALVVGLLKIPGILIHALTHPSKTMGTIVDWVSAFKNSNSILLRGLVAVLSIVPLATLFPFALIEKSISLITAGLKVIGHWFNKKPTSSAIPDAITTPLPTAKEGQKNDSYSSVMTNLVDKHVAQTVVKKTVEVSSHKKPLEILDAFELKLMNTQESGEVVNLSKKDFNKLNNYLQKQNKPALNKRFQVCCAEALSRANKLGPKTPAEVDEIIEVVNLSRSTM